MTNIIRFQFSKDWQVRFLSHLDLLRTLQRALRRAELPMAYSAGFTPRPKMSFGFALPVGLTSQAEYGDYEFNEDIDPEEFKSIYNAHLPPGLDVLRAQRLSAGSQSLMRLLNAAAYEVTLPCKTKNDLEERWNYLQNLDTLMVTRKTKRGSRELDILPLLYDLQIIAADSGGVTVSCLCALGEQQNLRLEELGQLLNFDYLDVSIRRTGQFIREGENYYPPWENRG